MVVNADATARLPISFLNRYFSKLTTTRFVKVFRPDTYFGDHYCLCIYYQSLGAAFTLLLVSAVVSFVLVLVLRWKFK